MQAHKYRSSLSGSEKALALAKENIQQNFIVVGMLEEVWYKQWCRPYSGLHMVEVR